MKKLFFILFFAFFAFFATVLKAQTQKMYPEKSTPVANFGGNPNDIDGKKYQPDTLGQDTELVWDYINQTLHYYDRQTGNWPELVNCLKVDDKAYVSKNGNNNRAKIGYPCFPFADPWTAAQAIADSLGKGTIHVLEGTYTVGVAADSADFIVPAATSDSIKMLSTLIRGDSLNFFFEDGAIVETISAFHHPIFYSREGYTTNVNGFGRFVQKSGFGLMIDVDNDSTIFNLKGKEIISENPELTWRNSILFGKYERINVEVDRMYHVFLKHIIINPSSTSTHDKNFRLHVKNYEADITDACIAIAQMDESNHQNSNFDIHLENCNVDVAYQVFNIHNTGGRNVNLHFRIENLFAIATKFTTLPFGNLPFTRVIFERNTPSTLTNGLVSIVADNAIIENVRWVSGKTSGGINSSYLFKISNLNYVNDDGDSRAYLVNTGAFDDNLQRFEIDGYLNSTLSPIIINNSGVNVAGIKAEFKVNLRQNSGGVGIFDFKNTNADYNILLNDCMLINDGTAPVLQKLSKGAVNVVAKNSATNKETLDPNIAIHGQDLLRYSGYGN